MAAAPLDRPLVLGRGLTELVRRAVALLENDERGDDLAPQRMAKGEDHCFI